VCYNGNQMALMGKLEKEIDDEGIPTDKERLTITVTNGTVVQIKELAVFLKEKGFPISEDLSDVVRTSLSLLLKLKEDKGNENE